MKKMLGWFLISVPFIAVAILGTISIGWQQTAAVFAITGIIVAIIGAGVHLAME